MRSGFMRGVLRLASLLVLGTVAAESPNMVLSSADLATTMPARRISHLALAGDWLAVGQGRTLYMVQTADPQHPHITQTLELPGRITALALAPGQVLAGIQPGGLAVLNFATTASVASPSGMIALTTVTALAGRINDLQVQQDRLHVAAQDFFIYQLQAGAAPQQLSRLTIGRAGQLAVSERFDYWLAPGPRGFAALQIDVTEPAVPKLSMQPIEMDWRTAELMPAPPAVFAEPAPPGRPAMLACVTDASGFHVFDVRAPLSPIRLGSLPVRGAITGLALTSATACLAVGAAGLQVVDIRDPRQPALLGIYYCNGQALQVAMRAPYAFVIDDLGLLDVIDLRQPVMPQRISGLELHAPAAASGTLPDEAEPVSSTGTN